MSESLFDRIGGEGAVNATVAKLYKKILNDELLAPYFDNIDIGRLRLSQSAFVTMAFEGPNNYTGETMRRAHARFAEDGLSDKHFDAVATHLKTAMEELSVPDELIAEALAIVETTRDDILNR
ncbi:MAG: group 1 truncated hemoglobin [Rickettsiales bacterium]|nr:group 1 truncated hemoglobin [Rickettsiales bacterium]